MILSIKSSSFLRINNGIMLFLVMVLGSCAPCPTCPAPCAQVVCPVCDQNEEIAPSTLAGSASNKWFVVHVTDGDTIIVKQKQLDNHFREEKIRFLNIDTPEKGEPLFGEAKEAIKSMLSGGDVVLEYKTPELETRGLYNRLLAYVLVDGVNTNIEMVRLGLTKYVTKYGKSRFHDEFLKAEEEARTKKIGVWKE